MDDKLRLMVFNGIINYERQLSESKLNLAKAELKILELENQINSNKIPKDNFQHKLKKFISESLKKMTTMKKPDLTDEMIVETSCKDFFLVTKGVYELYGFAGKEVLVPINDSASLRSLNRYNFDLTHVDNNKHDIDVVYDKKGNVLWKRESLPELTFDQVVEKLGFKFKLVKK